MFGVTLKEVQSYMDKKFDSFLKNEQKHRARTDHLCKVVQSLTSKSSHDKLFNETAVLKLRLHKLEEFLGIEYSAELISGYKKVKKTKK